MFNFNEPDKKAFRAGRAIGLFLACALSGLAILAMLCIAKLMVSFLMGC